MMSETQVEQGVTAFPQRRRLPNVSYDVKAKMKKDLSTIESQFYKQLKLQNKNSSTKRNYGRGGTDGKVYGVLLQGGLENITVWALGRCRPDGVEKPAWDMKQQHVVRELACHMVTTQRADLGMSCDEWKKWFDSAMLSSDREINPSHHSGSMSESDGVEPGARTCAPCACSIL
eukprot:TRINITY_DN4266_c0_g1_i2.p1 TRINITY_DN4266_c0_g1~~TRINITY_DN4266_c0_g1_i2.p1  ORF type:complete len:174 (+),score=22.99 TRINITY_DN4266_c0_g1_i2:203-724(+)